MTKPRAALNMPSEAMRVRPHVYWCLGVASDASTVTMFSKSGRWATSPLNMRESELAQSVEAEGE